MLGRLVRTSFLALAAWAVLFAPGAAGASLAADGTPVASDDLAASMIAPTFGPDGLLARAERADLVDEAAPAGVPIGPLAVAVTLVASLSLVHAAGVHAHRAPHLASALPAAPRGPPAV